MKIYSFCGLFLLRGALFLTEVVEGGGVFVRGGWLQPLLLDSYFPQMVLILSLKSV